MNHGKRDKDAAKEDTEITNEQSDRTTSLGSSQQDKDSEQNRGEMGRGDTPDSR